MSESEDRTVKVGLVRTRLSAVILLAALIGQGTIAVTALVPAGIVQGIVLGLITTLTLAVGIYLGETPTRWLRREAAILKALDDGEWTTVSALAAKTEMPRRQLLNVVERLGQFGRIEWRWPQYAQGELEFRRVE